MSALSSAPVAISLLVGNPSSVLRPVAVAVGKRHLNPGRRPVYQKPVATVLAGLGGVATLKTLRSVLEVREIPTTGRAFPILDRLRRKGVLHILHLAPELVATAERIVLLTDAGWAAAGATPVRDFYRQVESPDRILTSLQLAHTVAELQQVGWSLSAPSETIELLRKAARKNLPSAGRTRAEWERWSELSRPVVAPTPPRCLVHRTGQVRLLIEILADRDLKEDFERLQPLATFAPLSIQFVGVHEKALERAAKQLVRWGIQHGVSLCTTRATPFAAATPASTRAG